MGSITKNFGGLLYENSGFRPAPPGPVRNPVIPAGEAFQGIEATKGNNGYYLISDGDIHAYRARIRTPSFPHIQMVPMISTRGSMIPDFMAILGAVDYVLADVDR